MKFPVRVRFAPSPTGFMHVGNVRAALLNYLFARQHRGVFVLRIEDTDEQRNRKDAEDQITRDLAWLSLKYDEGPFFQSERHDIYVQYLNDFIQLGLVYRCFCSKEHLEIMRERQREQNKPPRYDRTCRMYSQEKIQRKLDFGLPFIWRFALDDHRSFNMHDLAKGVVTYQMSNFSDFAITREDGSFTFIFSNFVDDVVMNISHVIRGEDHLSNTALQLVMYDALARPTPTFWHLPLVCNEEGHKMSKRDFGFSLTDLRQAGYLPEAIINYLGTIGRSVDVEIQSLSELAKGYDFAAISGASSVRYDKDKLDWFNKKWIETLSIDDLVARLKPCLQEKYPLVHELSGGELETLIGLVRMELTRLTDVEKLLSFYFEPPALHVAELYREVSVDHVKAIVSVLEDLITRIHHGPDLFNSLKGEMKHRNIPVKSLFICMRFMLTGSLHGLAVNDLVDIFSYQDLVSRVHKFIDACR